MGISDERLRELAEDLARHMGIGPKPKRKLELVRPGKPLPLQPRNGMDAVTRDVIYARIRDLSRLYQLGWLVRQETEHVSGALECLTDFDLRSLRDKMERARECVVEGISFDDAGLIRCQGGV